MKALGLLGFLLDPNKDADYSIEAQQVGEVCYESTNNNSRSDGDINVSSKGLMLQQQVLSKDVTAGIDFKIETADAGLSNTNRRVTNSLVGLYRVQKKFVPLVLSNKRVYTGSFDRYRIVHVFDAYYAISIDDYNYGLFLGITMKKIGYRLFDVVVDFHRCVSYHILKGFNPLLKITCSCLNGVDEDLMNLAKVYDLPYDAYYVHLLSLKGVTLLCSVSHVIDDEDFVNRLRSTYILVLV
ncbi:hypothetical protein Tco_1029638 [Tanacetum coccineum]|uniref:Uncharacterized protein n=1 Tax=Tanacetum coccineum TaxID=301880 RepID=A0ABQ5G400_9ASTR